MEYWKYVLWSTENMYGKPEPKYFFMDSVIVQSGYRGPGI